MSFNPSGQPYVIQYTYGGAPPQGQYITPQQPGYIQPFYYPNMPPMAPPGQPQLQPPRDNMYMMNSSMNPFAQMNPMQHPQLHQQPPPSYLSTLPPTSQSSTSNAVPPPNNMLMMNGGNFIVPPQHQHPNIQQRFSEMNLNMDEAPPQPMPPIHLQPPPPQQIASAPPPNLVRDANNYERVNNDFARVMKMDHNGGGGGNNNFNNYHKNKEFSNTFPTPPESITPSSGAGVQQGGGGTTGLLQATTSDTTLGVANHTNYQQQEVLESVAESRNKPSSPIAEEQNSAVSKSLQPTNDIKKVEQVVELNQQNSQQQYKTGGAGGAAKGKTEATKSATQGLPSSHNKICLYCKLQSFTFTDHSLLNDREEIICPQLLKVKCNICEIIGHPEILCSKRIKNEKFLQFAKTFHGRFSDHSQSKEKFQKNRDNNYSTSNNSHYTFRNSTDRANNYRDGGGGGSRR